MELTINGEKQQLGVRTVAELLEQLSLSDVRCATMVNGRVVKRLERSTTELNEHDEVEVITMVGGG